MISDGKIAESIPKVLARKVVYKLMDIGGIPVKGACFFLENLSPIADNKSSGEGFREELVGNRTFIFGNFTYIVYVVF